LSQQVNVIRKNNIMSASTSNANESKSPSDDERSERVKIPDEYFTYCGAATKDGNSMYKCRKCSVGAGGKKV